MRLEIKYNKGDSRHKQVKEQTQSRKKKKEKFNKILYANMSCQIRQSWKISPVHINSNILGGDTVIKYEKLKNKKGTGPLPLSPSGSLHNYES